MVTWVRAGLPRAVRGTAPAEHQGRVLPSGVELWAAPGTEQGKNCFPTGLLAAKAPLLRPFILHTLHLSGSVYQVVKHSHI